MAEAGRMYGFGFGETGRWALIAEARPEAGPPVLEPHVSGEKRERELGC